MVDVLFGEFQKKLIRIGANMIMKKMGASPKIVDYDLEGTSNKSIKAIDNIIMGAVERTKPKYQKEMLKTYSRLSLWILTKDTAYRDTFFWMLYNLLANSEKIMPLVEPYVKDPSEWYPNVWFDARMKTAELRKENRIPDNEMSLTEKVFKPKYKKKK